MNEPGAGGASAAPQLTVIIPTLDEAAGLPRLLAQLRAQRGIALEIIAADGGSTDGTPQISAAAGARAITSPRGRGRQMNAGAAAARAETLLFLHADSQLETPNLLADAFAALHRAVAETGGSRIAGHWPLHFTAYPPQAAPFYRHLEGKTALNRPYTINGDQGLLISARWFRELGSYDERLPFLEDQRMAAKIFAQGRWLLLPGRLATSARRFEAEGRRERYTLMALIMGLHAAGADEFFAQAPAIYAAQRETGRLDLAPFLSAIRETLRQRGRLATLCRAGRFVRENTWQLFYWRDQRHSAAGLPRLRFYDRYLHRLTQNPLADVLATLLLSLWFYLWLPLTRR
ncbi:MAG: TIGR04283 family arsenosugar biosynthesis glycosyltransferase [Stenotrophobium sp.]